MKLAQETDHKSFIDMANQYTMDLLDIADSHLKFADWLNDASKRLNDIQHEIKDYLDVHADLAKMSEQLYDEKCKSDQRIEELEQEKVRSDKRIKEFEEKIKNLENYIQGFKDQISLA